MPLKNSTIQTTQPLFKEAEISIFGPGVGECIVVHRGGGEWFVVDSCVCPKTKRPIALIYLESLGVNPKTQIKALIITHWDNDHIRGAFDIVRECPNAKILFSQALHGSEAFTLARAYGKNTSSKLDEEILDFYNIVNYAKNNPHSISTVKSKTVFFSNSEYSSRLIALSPSDEATNQAVANIVGHTQKVGERRKKAKVKTSRNLNAVALYFEFNGYSALLGSDLEEPSNSTDYTGWSAIINSGIIKDLEISKSDIFKVPHHGSITGHHDDVIEKMLIDKPISATTPYTVSSLPAQVDLKRISGYSKEFWITTEQGGKIKRPRDVTNIMKRHARDWFTINQKMGHVQIRFSKGNEIEVRSNELAKRY